MSGLVNTADVYTAASELAQKRAQSVGANSDLYITLEQLELILQDLQVTGIEAQAEAETASNIAEAEKSNGN